MLSWLSRTFADEIRVEDRSILPVHDDIRFGVRAIAVPPNMGGVQVARQKTIQDVAFMQTGRSISKAKEGTVKLVKLRLVIILRLHSLAVYMAIQ